MYYLLNNLFTSIFTFTDDVNLPTPVVSNIEKLTAIEVDEDETKIRIKS